MRVESRDLLQGDKKRKLKVVNRPYAFEISKISILSIIFVSLMAFMFFSCTPSKPPLLIEKKGQKFTNGLGMEFVYISPGTFLMGSPSTEFLRYSNEKQHRVTLTKGFYLQTTEVTQEQWRTVMGYNPALFKKCGDNCPVELVSWNEIQKFVKKLNRREKTRKYRLPTEAEWEYACRAGSTTRFSYGNDDEKLGEYAWYYDNSGRRSHPVGQEKPNPWGLYDMHGNVLEWCLDWYGLYPAGAVTDPVGLSDGVARSFRGGSWYVTPKIARSAFRYGYPTSIRAIYLGFRLLRMP